MWVLLAKTTEFGEFEEPHLSLSRRRPRGKKKKKIGGGGIPLGEQRYLWRENRAILSLNRKEPDIIKSRKGTSEKFDTVSKVDFLKEQGKGQSEKKQEIKTTTSPARKQGNQTEPAGRGGRQPLEVKQPKTERWILARFQESVAGDSQGIRNAKS